MPRHLMVVLSNARTDAEDEFNRWYDEHVVDTIEKLDGFAAAQRFELAPLAGADSSPYRYLAVYEVEDDRLERAHQQFLFGRQERADAAAAGREPLVKVSDTLDPTSFVVGFYSAITERTPASRLAGADEDQA